MKSSNDWKEPVENSIRTDVRMEVDVVHLGWESSKYIRGDSEN